MAPTVVDQAPDVMREVEENPLEEEEERHPLIVGVVVGVEVARVP